MDAYDAVKKRRSIRRYKSEAPTDAELEQVLEAGRWAPSGLNNQPWRFMVLRDAVRRAGLAAFTKYGNIIRAAPIAIAVFIDTSESYNRDKDLMAIGASIENMLIAVTALGLGACWLGEIVNRKDDVEKYLAAGRDLELVAVVTIGYPAEEVGKGTRKALKELLIG